MMSAQYTRYTKGASDKFSEHQPHKNQESRVSFWNDDSAMEASEELSPVEATSYSDDAKEG
jgi:hypothetical protein